MRTKRDAAPMPRAADAQTLNGRGKVKPGKPKRGKPARRSPHGGASRDGRRPADVQSRQGRTRDHRALQHGPATTPNRRAARPTGTKQAKARAKARKAKAPKVIRVPLRERLATRIASIDLSPRSLAARVPFVVLVIGALGVGLGVTLWLSTDAAERSYQLGSARAMNQELLQQKEGLERDVLEAQAAPALAESARNLGMIPSRDTAHLIQDPTGSWIVVGNPKPAEGVPPPPLNIKLPDDTPASAQRPARPVPTPEQPVRMPETAPIPAIAAIPVIPGPAAPATPLDAAAAPEVVASPQAVVAPPEAAAPLEHAPVGPPPVVTPGAPVTGPLPGPAVIPGAPVTGPLPGPVDVQPPAPLPGPAEPPALVPAPGGPA